jgi:hypothetical protein
VERPSNSGASADTVGDGPELAATCKKQKQKQKKELIVEFVREQNDGAFAVERNVQVLKLTKRTMQKVWSAEKNTHPPDIHFDVKCFSQ